MSRDRLYQAGLPEGSAPIATTAAEARRLRIVNLNTWIGCLPKTLLEVLSIEPEGHKQRRFDALVEELVERSPDVITLQECLPQPSFVRRLAKALDYDLVWRVCNSGLRLFGIGVPTGVERGEGLAILAKRSLKLKKLAVKRLSGYGLVNNHMSFQIGALRFVLATRIHLEDGRSCIVATTHISYAFPSKDLFRRGWSELYDRGVTRHRDAPRWLVRMSKDHDAVRDKELRRLARWLTKLRQRHQEPVLLGADFNLDPDTPQVARFIDKTGFFNALPAVSPGVLTWDPATNENIAFDTTYRWPDGSPKRPILQLMAWLDTIPQCPDHVLLSPELELVGAGRAFDRPRGGVLASDHYGIWADVGLSS